MLVEWLYRTTLEVSLLIGLVLLVRPAVRRTLGARAAYWLWFVPLARAVLIDRPEWPRALVERAGVPGGELSIALYSSPEAWALPAAVPWVALWLGGALLWLALRIIGAIRFRRTLLSEAAAIALPSQLSALIPQRLQRRRPRYFAADLPGTPFVTGLLRPLVYLPTDFFERFSLDEQKWVVQHELTHAARADLWVQSLWELLRAVFWFNPIVHLAVGAMRDDQELACDQACLRGSSNDDRYSYGKALLIGGGAQLFPSLLHFFGNQRKRIAMIRKHKTSLRRDVAGIGLCALVAVLALTKAPVSVADLVSDDPVTLNFRSLPVAAFVDVIVKGFGPETVTGLERLGDRRVTLQVEGVPAREVLQRVLNCAGFTYEERGEVLAIVPSEAQASAACAGMTLE